jgi:hypothetical protein
MNLLVLVQKTLCEPLLAKLSWSKDLEAKKYVRSSYVALATNVRALAVFEILAYGWGRE